MCDCEIACFEAPRADEYRKLTPLLLDCWQREYDTRPYKNFQFQRLDFEKRMTRLYDPVEDFVAIAQLIKSRDLWSIKLEALKVLSHKSELINSFVESLYKLKFIELKLMQMPTEFFQALAEKALNLNVKELILTGTPLNDKDVLCLRIFLIKSRTLRSLNVSACSLNQHNFAILADGVHKSESLVAFTACRLLGEHLSLDTEKITMIVSSLVWKNQLQELDMQMCEFKAQDMEVLAEYMYSKSSSLVKLNMAYNKIGPDGARYLLQAISVSGTLKYLDISGCGLGSHGGEYVAKYLSSCSRLESLRIQFNDIDAETISLILLTMKKPLRLQKLAMWGNRYDNRTGSILRRLIESRTLPQDSIDVTYTCDDTISGYRVIPWRT